MIEQREKWLKKKRKNLQKSFADERCNYCQKQKEKMFKCKGCNTVLYCCRSHQKKDWSSDHAVFCKTSQEHANVINVSTCFMFYFVVDEIKPTFRSYWRAGRRACGFEFSLHVYTVYTWCKFNMHWNLCEICLMIEYFYTMYFWGCIHCVIVTVYTHCIFSKIHSVYNGVSGVYIRGFTRCIFDRVLHVVFFV